MPLPRECRYANERTICIFYCCKFNLVSYNTHTHIVHKNIHTHQFVHITLTKIHTHTSICTHNTNKNTHKTQTKEFYTDTQTKNVAHEKI